VFYVRALVHAATDAEAYWFGPVVGAGAGLVWPSRWGVLAEYQYFTARKDAIDSYYGREVGYWHQQSAGTYLTWQSGRTGRGFFAMAGLVWQWRRAKLEWDFGEIFDNRSFLTAAVELGYRWPAWHNGGLAFSVKATGPLSYTDGPVETIEILTQLSAGIAADIALGKTMKKRR
jgi:hypothetical protein